MLSICIAIHNWNVNRLVKDLRKQALKLDVPFEILLLDDASDYDYQLKNAHLDYEEHVTYFQSYVNLGRSLARNTLAAKAKHPYLLFLDCDATVTHRDFLKKYLSALPAKVVVGGCEYQKRRPKRNCILRWQYGLKREQIPAHVRNQHPNSAFSAFNFLIEKKVFDQIKFDETLRGYGHEDTLFGLDLLDHQITVNHIDNPLRHDGIFPTDDFLQRTQNAIRNLLVILEMNRQREALIQSIRLLRTYQKMKKCRMVWLYRLFYKIFKKIIVKNLYSTKPNIRFFDLYKLGYLCEAKR